MTTDKTVGSNIARQAADWFIIMHADEPPCEETLQEFIHWLKDTKAEHAYAQCEILWEISSGLKNDPNIINSRNNIRTLRSPKTLTPQKQKFSVLIYPLLAACLSLVIVLLVWSNQFFTQQHLKSYQTATGQQKNITLSDGSLLTLNTSSKITVQFNKKMRNITLETGEVFFNVAKDKNRPFLVQAGNGQIKALGTRFYVKKLVNQKVVEVALIEGKVEVNADIEKHNNNNHSNKQLLYAQQKLSYSPKFLTKAEKITDIEEITQWKEGRLSFSDTSLEEVIEQVNRYTTTKIILDDQELQAEKINAYFVIGDTETLLLALKETLDIRWEYHNNGIFIYRESPVE